MRYVIVLFMVFSLFMTACGSDPDDGTSVVTIAVVGGNPDGVAVAGSGNIYITDVASGEVKKIDPNGKVTVVADLNTITGDTTHPDGITAVTTGTTDVLYVADMGSVSSGFSTDGRIVKIEVAGDGSVTTTEFFVDSAVLNNPTGIAADNSGNLYIADQERGDVYKVAVTGGVAGVPQSLTGSLPAGVTLVEPHGVTLKTNSDNSITLYTTDQGSNSNNVVQIDIPASGTPGDAVVSELTPDSTGGSATGTTDTATFNQPHGIGTDKNGAVFISDENNNRVQIITPGGNVITFAGSGASGDADGDADMASFNQPRVLAVDSNGDVLICDYGNGKVRKIVR
jgi:sugar lactone lactonase YvrE